MPVHLLFTQMSDGTFKARPWGSQAPTREVPEDRTLVIEVQGNPFDLEGVSRDGVDLDALKKAHPVVLDAEWVGGKFSGPTNNKITLHIPQED